MRIHSRALLYLLLVGGCSNLGNNADFDGDGSTDAVDCAPSDANIHPLADELCSDGLDNDCDDWIDCADNDCDSADDCDPGDDDDSNGDDDDSAAGDDDDSAAGDDDDSAAGDDDDTPTGDDDDSATGDDDDSSAGDDDDNTPDEAPCNSMEFDGSATVVIVPNDQALSVGNGQTTTWTIEGWFRSDAVTTTQYLLSKGSDPLSHDHYDYYLAIEADSTLTWATGDSSDSCAQLNISLPPTGWHHFAATLAAAGSNTGTKQLYLDGVLQGSCNYISKWPALTGGDLVLGGRATGTSPDTHFDGVLDEVRVSSIVRYFADFTPETQPETDAWTTALWHFDGGVAGTAVDAASNHDATMQNGSIAPYCPHSDDDGDGSIAWLDCDDTNSALVAFDGASSTCPGTSCRQLLDEGHASLSDTYWLNPNRSTAPFQASCDMSEDGGGWTLIGMIHRATQNDVDEPQNWFQAGNNQHPSFSANQFLVNAPPSAFGAERFTALLETGSIARFEVHETLADGSAGSGIETAYRQIASPEVFRNWWLSDTNLSGSGTSLFCEDLAMTLGCVSTSIDGGNNNHTYFGNCVSGSGSSCWVTRLNDDWQIYASSVATDNCVTGQSPPGPWCGYWNGWGHGLKIWLRE